MDRDTGVTAVTSVTEVQAGKGPARGSVLLGKYRVESTLGFGGMGLVIKAHNVQLDEDVAIKILREDVQLDEDHITRFLREAKNAVRLKSEHVARIRDVGTFEDGRPYMVMELLEGLDLGRLLLDHGRIEPTRAVDLLLQACDAIAEAHSLGIVHRDIKPTNLFVAKRRDGSDLLKVLDFGISKATVGSEMALTQTQSMLGTPAYMSPEQMRSARTADQRSDIWSLGCVLYELVEGHQPFEASNFAELCVMVATEDPQPLVHGPQVGGVLMRCLAKDLDERYQHVGELAVDLAPLSSDPESAQHQVTRILRLIHRGSDSRDGTPVPKTGLGMRTPLPGSTPVLRAGVAGTGTRMPPVPAAPVGTHTTIPGPGVGPLSMPRPVAPRRLGPGTLIAILAVLFVVGVGVGLLVWRGGGDTSVATPNVSQDAAATIEMSGSDESVGSAGSSTGTIDMEVAGSAFDEVTVEHGSAAGSAAALP
ncbi:MAG TPA: serine/threonine-protein kinase, partial [Kofleriaceae bacterium]|nr:serine/threonine-protein kinase [Kofleriaceae bacterium]